MRLSKQQKIVEFSAVNSAKSSSPSGWPPNAWHKDLKLQLQIAQEANGDCHNGPDPCTSYLIYESTRTCWPVQSQLLVGTPSGMGNYATDLVRGGAWCEVW